MTFGEEFHTALGWDGHQLLLHKTETQRLAELAAWVRDGLDRNEKVVYVQDSRSDEGFGVLVALAEHGIDIEAAISGGQFEFVAPGEFFTPGGPSRRVERALATSGAGVRMSTEACAMSRAASAGMCEKFERVVEELCRRYPLSALCQYEQQALSGTSLREAAEIHVAGIRSPQLHTAREGAGLVLAGELDLANGELLAALLGAACEAANGHLVLGMRQVTFLGVVAARALVEGTQRFRDQGGQVMLVAPPANTEWFLRALGIDRMAHVALEEGG